MGRKKERGPERMRGGGSLFVPTFWSDVDDVDGTTAHLRKGKEFEAELELELQVQVAGNV